MRLFWSGLHVPQPRSNWPVCLPPARQFRRPRPVGLHHAGDHAADCFEAAEGFLFPRSNTLNHSADIPFVVPIDADDESAAPAQRRFGAHSVFSAPLAAPPTAPDAQRSGSACLRVKSAITSKWS